MKYRFTVHQLEAMASYQWLTDREKCVFELFYRKGWEIESIAAELDVSRGTINNVLKSIRGKTTLPY
jgi:predicted DNA-binding protein YlxM (UPF0122 family)